MIKSLRYSVAFGTVALLGLSFAGAPAGAAGGPVLVQFNSSADLEVIDAPGNSTNLRVIGHDANFRVESSTTITAGRDCTRFQTGNRNRPFGANCNYRPVAGDNAQFTAWQGTVLGGDGNDVISYEVERGGLVAGGAGNDKITLNNGITLNVFALGDSFGNNPGDGARGGADTINSADGQVDSIVNCGPSDGANDAVQFDGFDGMKDCSNNDLFA